MHGSAPDIAGRNLANPTAAFSSAAMLLEHGLGRPDDAARLRRAIDAAARAHLTPDRGGSASTDEFGDAVLAQLKTEEPARA